MGLPEGYEIADTIPINLALTLESIARDIENSNQTLASAKKSISVAEQVLRENKAERSPIINFTSAYNFNRIENELGVAILNQ